MHAALRCYVRHRLAQIDPEFRIGLAETDRALPSDQAREPAGSNPNCYRGKTLDCFPSLGACGAASASAAAAHAGHPTSHDSWPRSPDVTVETCRYGHPTDFLVVQNCGPKVQRRFFQCI